MLTNRSISIFGIALLIVSYTAIPSIAKSDNNSKLISHTIKSASELDYPPFSLVREDGTPDGFSVDLLKAVIQAAGLDINFITGPWHEIKQKLIDGQIDVLPFVSYSKERDKVLDFTAPYLRMHGTIFVRKGEKEIRSETDLRDKEVLVMRGDTAHEYAVSKNLSDKLILTDSFEQAMKLLSDGKHDAVIIQQLVGFQLIKKLNISNIISIGSSRESNLKLAAKPLSGFEQKFCIAVQEGDKELLTLLNEGLAIVIANGTYEVLYNKWFGPILPQPPVSFSMIAKYLLSILLPVLFLIGIIGIWYLKREVAGKTKHLRKEIQERGQVEDALRKSEENLSITLDSIGDAVIATDIEGRITRMNPVAEHLTGWRLEDALGISLNKTFNIVNARTKKPVVNPVRQVLETGRIVGLANHTLLISKNGNQYQIADSAAPIRNAAGDILGIVLVFRDVTERHQMREAVQESEQYLRSILHAAPIGIGVVIDRVLKQVNERICEMTGYSEEELINQSARIFYPSDDDYEYVGNEKYRQIQKHGTGTVETRWLCKDGHIIEVLLSSTPVDINDPSKGVTFTALDITSRKQDEKALRASHERFFTVLNSIDATIYVADMETYEILFMNKHMIESFGRDLTGETCWDVYRGESGPCSFCTNDQLIDENKKLTGVHTWQDKNPVTGRLYNNYDRAIEWTDGRLVKIQIATDITSFKKIEAQLQQAQKMESIGTLAGGIAHDFNNILFPIVGHTEMLMEDAPENSPFRDSLNEIYTGALRARDLVQQILTFSRQDNSELKLMKMQPIIKEALKLIRSSIPTTIKIKQDLNADCGVIKADPTQIHQIVMNLSTNAYHAMEETGGELKISLKEIELGELDRIAPDMAPGVYACLTITDTGTGMDQVVTEKIFNPFFTTKEKGKGTGMGLSVVHGIVKNMNGAIKVYSEPGKGTKFYVYLPVVMSSSAKQEILQMKEPIQGGIERILLVDDEDAIITMEKLMLERLGYQVTSRTSSIEALEAFRDSPDKFDVVITDMAMPNMAGDKLSAELTKIRPDIPILLCTGFSETMSEEKAASSGIKGFLLKPIIMKDFSKKIRDVLDNMKSSI